ncbi:MAG TPA: 4-carboxymuconolactone decarboxylase [Hypericibacter adhaerens]|uniref:4-carboxymuconolactone decarboxylase n=1 Tax=Hypericibacter adhaerens TaxID=2602016 RepID=UPI002C4D1C0F|nr:4-carboxymuconolactone decarboxylase [Hypericibacter adhaerens]HWA42170.1 4-carboxymuconolactone decarboxylase [Hypericibacter adhaerens]
MSVTEIKSPRLRQGEKTRREVLSDQYVERTNAATTPFDAPFQELITEAAWGNLWSRNEWTRRERSIVTISLLAALGHYEEMAMHIRATARTGASEADVREALLHVAIYAGVPTANTAFRIAKQVFSEMEAEKT